MSETRQRAEVVDLPDAIDLTGVETMTVNQAIEHHGVSDMALRAAIKAGRILSYGRCGTSDLGHAVLLLDAKSVRSAHFRRPKSGSNPGGRPTKPFTLTPEPGEPTPATLTTPAPLPTLERAVPTLSLPRPLIPHLPASLQRCLRAAGAQARYVEALTATMGADISLANAVQGASDELATSTRIRDWVKRKARIHARVEAAAAARKEYAAALGEFVLALEATAIGGDE